MGIIALIFLPFRIINIFGGYTFTDIEDFGPLLTLIIGLCGAVQLYISPPKKASFALTSLMCLLSLWPILPNIGLFLLAREFHSVRGYWPQAFVDDPAHWFGHVSAQFQAVFRLIGYLEDFSCAWAVVFFTLAISAESRFSRPQRRLYTILAVIAVILCIIDPGNLYMWWLD